MVDFCKSFSPFHVCLTIRPFAHLVYATSHLSFVTFYSYLVSWLTMIWACQIWIKCDKRQMTRCVHKMCGWTYGQTNMKRAMTLTKINHPWNWYDMLLCELRAYTVAVLSRQLHWLDTILLYTVTDRNIVCSGTPVTCYLLSFGHLIIPPLAEWWVYWKHI
jgi:hypothetical protein